MINDLQTVRYAKLEFQMSESARVKGNRKKYFIAGCKVYKENEN